MNRHLLILSAWAAVMLCACNESVTLTYPTKADAQSEKQFARGWLPTIIPPSSRAITMKNNLDLNTSHGQFHFDSSDHHRFISALTRAPAQDKKDFTAYQFQNWSFFIHHDKNYCKFSMSNNNQ